MVSFITASKTISAKIALDNLFWIPKRNKSAKKLRPALIDKLLLEGLALAAIARVVDVSERWLQKYVKR